ncbi:Transcription factor IIIA [Rhynchospora pubera]|uniref:Transcription factor IIIA n=1 Tax=Rhynchospora pubera TaxID=906938 RepID=A0AAV8AN48_9POAL|nr:Transcription factor IIIA [Rhynchospora pubera]
MESDPNKAIPAEAEVEAEKGEETKKRDIRRYACEYCGIVRSKRALITSHILSEHQEEAAAQVDREEEEREKMEEERKRCKECGVWFKKPAHLKQHMLSHSSEKPFSCPIEDCKSSYGRKDHLNRHLLSHQARLFVALWRVCSSKFVIKGNLNRHVKEFHECPDRRQQKQKEFVCQEVGCGKTFRFASKLATHEESHGI